MDPLSITAATLGFAGFCACILRNIKDTISRFQDVPQSLSRLDRGIGILVAALFEVERMLQASQGTSTTIINNPRIACFLHGCHDTLERLQNDLDCMMRAENWVDKAAVMCREDEISRMLVSLEQETQSLHMIIGILNTRSIDDTKRSIGRMQASIDDLRERLSSSVITPTKQTFADRELELSPCPDDDFTLVEDTPSRESSPSLTKFAFDDELLKSRTYRKRLANSTHSRKRRLSSSTQMLPDRICRTPLRDIQNDSREGASHGPPEARPCKKRKGDQIENAFGYFEDYIGIFEVFQEQ